MLIYFVNEYVQQKKIKIERRINLDYNTYLLQDRVFNKRRGMPNSSCYKLIPDFAIYSKPY